MGARHLVGGIGMRTRWLAIAAMVLGAVTGALTVGAASATDPVHIDTSSHVTDEAGALSAAELATAQDRLRELKKASDVDLFVVYVDSFTDPSDAAGWADRVVADNQLGTRDYLLAVAIDDRNYIFSADPSGPISASQQDAIERVVEQHLSDSDWAGAITAAADEIQGDGGAGAFRVILIVLAIVVLAIVVWLIVRQVGRSRRAAEARRRGAMPEKADPNDPFSTLTDEQVQSQAGVALVRADDAITSSTEELGFAVAQFGDEATATFTAAIETAKAKMAEAFDLKQKLDDEIEDSVFDRRTWHIHIIQLCAEIDDVLDDNTEAFDALRKLEQNAPQELERVRTERAAAQPLLSGTQAALDALRSRYDAAALATVADNPAQAHERIGLADRSIDAAAQAIAEGRSGNAAFAIRTAEQSVAQAAQLAQAISTLGSSLAGLETQAGALIAELQSDMGTAQQLPDPTGAISAAISATAQQVQVAQQGLGATLRDPQRVLDALTVANSQIDAAIAQGRESVERARRDQQVLDQTIAQADAQIRAARDFIQTRRGSIGSQARTRLSQAEAAMTQAQAQRTVDPGQSLSAARSALDLARQATSYAQSDVSSYDQQAYGGQRSDDDWSGGLFGGSGSRSNDSGLAGDILGGIIGGLLSGGGGGSSRRSSGWRSSGGGGFRSSGFGGGGGGRSSGGGRRTGGGRF
ncbi:MAG: TPM domain-containing protein [Microbacterium sp.]|nr:TPM domain-containing protein [Microbacterium sp.]